MNISIQTNNTDKTKLYHILFTPKNAILITHSLGMVHENKTRYSSSYNRPGRPRIEEQLHSFFKLGTKAGWVVNAMPQPLYPGERRSTHWIRSWVGPRASLDRCWKSHHHWDLIPIPSRVKWVWYRRIHLLNTNVCVGKKIWKIHAVNAQLSLQWRSRANSYQQPII